MADGRPAFVEINPPVEADDVAAGGANMFQQTGGPGEPFGATFHNYHGYQLNLIRNNPALGRLNLAAHSDWQWMRETGDRRRCS